MSEHPQSKKPRPPEEIKEAIEAEDLWRAVYLARVRRERESTSNAEQMSV
jgi:hypothetical protein